MSKLPGNGVAAAVTDERRRNGISISLSTPSTVAVAARNGRQTTTSIKVDDLWPLRVI